MSKIREDLLFMKQAWFQFPWCFLKVLKPDQAILLAALINIAEMKDSYMEERWFRVSRNRLKKFLHMSENRQKKLLRELREIGVVEVAMRGMPIHREIRIPRDGICNILRHIDWAEYKKPQTSEMWDRGG